ncbi:MAG: hypothetical protein ACLFVU_05240 [Phycisphaerae bacterium]
MNDRQLQSEERFDELLGDLSLLRQRIDEHTFPGRAWQVPASRSGRPAILRWAAGAAAVAALIAVLVTLAVVLQQPEERQMTVTQDLPDTGEEPVELSFGVPTDIDPGFVAETPPTAPAPMESLDPSLTAEITMDVPTFYSPVEDVDQLEWEIPTLSIPSSDEGSNDYDES